LEIETASLFDMNDAPKDRQALDDYRDRIIDAIKLDDIIDGRIADVDYMLEVAKNWHPWLVIENTEALRNKLVAQQKRLDDAVRDMEKRPSNPPAIPFSGDQVERIPPEWQLKQVATRSTASLTVLWGKRTDSELLQIPAGRPGSPI